MRALALHGEGGGGVGEAPPGDVQVVGRDVVVGVEVEEEDVEAVLREVDLVVTPTSPTAAFRLGEKTDDPLQMYLADIFTVSANLTGAPGISIPCGFAAGQLPVGLQLTGRMFDEATLLKVADAYERLTDWHTRRPNI